MTINNIIIPFTLKNSEVKGRITRIDNDLDIILNQHQYPDPIAKILGELLIVSSLIGSQFKNDILLTIQLQIKDTNQYIVADYQSPGNIRGYANFDKIEESKTYSDIVSNSLLMVTIDQQNNNRYQGVVEIKNNNISQAIEEYFYQSEQINTLIKLSIGKIILPKKHEAWCGSGIMLQKLPHKNEESSWEEAQIYFSTIRDDELLDPNLNLEDLLYSVFNQMDVTIYEPLTIIHKCRCSRERVEKVIESLGYEEANSILIDDLISVSCQFCNKSQNFSKTDLEKIFNRCL
jgi:molecular chaperone Hsp33